MNIEDIKNQAVNTGLKAVNAIRQAFQPAPTPQQPQMSRLQPAQPQMSRVQPAQIQSTRNRQFIQSLSPINKPLIPTIPGTKPLVLKPMTAKAPEAPRQETNFDKWMKVLGPSDQQDALSFQVNKWKNEFGDFLTNQLGPAIKEYTLQKARSGTFETPGMPGGFQEGEKIAGEIRATLKGPEELAKTELAEANLFVKKGELGLRTAVAPFEIFNKSVVQPLWQTKNLMDRERDLGIKATPEELQKARLGELNISKNDLYNIKYEKVPAEFYLPNTSDAYIKKRQELGLNDAEIERRKKNNTDYILNETFDVIAELIDPSLLIPGGQAKGVLKAEKAVAKTSKLADMLQKAREGIAFILTDMRAVLADNRGFIDADKFTDLWKNIMKDNIPGIEKEIGRKLTKQEIDKLKSLQGLPATKKFYDKLRSGVKGPVAPVGKIARGQIDEAVQTAVDQGKIILDTEKGTRQFNINRFPFKKKEIARAILNKQEEIVSRAKGPMTLESIEKKAQNIFFPISQDAKRLFDKISGSDLAEQIAVQVLRNDAKAMDIITKNGGVATKEFFDTYMRSANVKTGTAQLLNSYRVTAKKVKDMNAVDKMNLLTSKLKELDIYETKYQEMVDYAIKNKLDLNDPKQFERLYREFVPATVWDWMEKIGYNSMLSAVSTFINSGTFVSTVLWNTANYTIRGLLESSLYAGKKIIGKNGMLPPKYDGWSGLRFMKKAMTGFAKELGGTGNLLLNIVKGIGDGTKSLMQDGFEFIRNGKLGTKTEHFGSLKKAFDEFKTKVDESFVGQYEETSQIVPLSKEGTLARKFENLLDVPQFILSGIDGFLGNVFKSAFEGAYNPAYKKSLKNSVTALNDFDKQVMGDTLKSLLRGELDEKGLGLMNEIWGSMGRALNTARYSGNEVVRFISQSIIPFVKVPINYMRQGLESTPVGVTNFIGSKDRMDVLSKLITGSIFGTWVVSEYTKGRITGAYPTDPVERERWKKEGVQPYSYLADNLDGTQTWVDYTKYAPQFAVLMGIYANSMDAYRKGDITDGQYEKVIMYTQGLLNYFSDQSFVDNFRIFKDLANPNYSKQATDDFVANILSQRIPFFGTSRWASRYLNEGVMKDPQTWQETIMKDVPGLADKVPNKYDEEGKLIINPYYTYNSFPLVGKFSQQKGDDYYEKRIERDKEVYFNRSRTAIENLFEDERNRVLSGLQTDIYSGEANKYLGQLNVEDTNKYYYFEPNVRKVKTIDMSFLNERPQTTKELMEWTKKYNDKKNEIMMLPFIPNSDLKMLYDRLDVPEADRYFPSQEDKDRLYKVPVKEEGVEKPQATREQRKEQAIFAQEDKALKQELESVRAYRKLGTATGTGRRGKRLTAKKPTLPSSKIGKLKLPKVPKAKKIKVAKLKVPKAPKKSIKKKVNI